MQPECNRKNSDDKTQILQTPHISLFSCCVLISTWRDIETNAEKLTKWYPVRMQPGCTRKNKDDKTQILQTPELYDFLWHRGCMLTGLQKKQKSWTCSKLVRMQPGWNRKSKDDKTQILQTPNKSLFTVCILVASELDFGKQREKSNNFEIPLGCHQDATGKTRMTRPKSSRSQTNHLFPAASWLHPNGISSKKSETVERHRNPLRMQPGCIGNKNEKTQLLQSLKISLFSWRILLVSSRNYEVCGKVEKSESR